MTTDEFDVIEKRIEGQIDAHMAAHAWQRMFWAGIKAFVLGPKVLGAVKLALVMEGFLTIPQPPVAVAPTLPASSTPAPAPPAG